MTMTSLLVMTVGQTDVQLVADGHRREFDKRTCADLHDKLERRRNEWSIVDPPTEKSKDRVTKLPGESFNLCTPKLDAVLTYLRGVQDLSVLLLETRREKPRSDPRYAGAVLEKRLGDLGIKQVTRKAYLEGSERLEDHAVPCDAMLRREVVDRIDHAIGETIRVKQPQRVVVATTGGFPVVGTLVDEVVQLYAGRAKVELLEVADSSQEDETMGDRAVPRHRIPEPAESYRARRHALELIEKGSLLGAWGAVRHLHNNPVEREWTQIVEWLSLFASSLPLPDECDLDLLRHPKTAVKVALRVELALRAKDIPRAIHGTVAFFEAALWDHLRPHVQEQGRRIYKVDPAPDKSLIRVLDESKLTSKKKKEDNRKRPFVPSTNESSDEVCYRIFDDNVGSIKLAKHYLECEHLARLGQAVSEVRDLRNDVAHNEPTPKLMNDARTRMSEVGLWTKVSSPNKPTFLAQPLVVDVLDELGVEKPKNLLESLLEDVRHRILHPY
jgi:hypothetical protein